MQSIRRQHATVFCIYVVSSSLCHKFSINSALSAIWWVSHLCIDYYCCSLLRLYEKAFLRWCIAIFSDYRNRVWWFDNWRRSWDCGCEDRASRFNSRWKSCTTRMNISLEKLRYYVILLRWETLHFYLFLFINSYSKNSTFCTKSTPIKHVLDLIGNINVGVFWVTGSKYNRKIENSRWWI